MFVVDLEYLIKGTMTKNNSSYKHESESIQEKSTYLINKLHTRQELNLIHASLIVTLQNMNLWIRI